MCFTASTVRAFLEFTPSTTQRQSRDGPTRGRNPSATNPTAALTERPPRTAGRAAEQDLFTDPDWDPPPHSNERWVPGKGRDDGLPCPLGLANPYPFSQLQSFNSEVHLGPRVGPTAQ